MKNGKGQPVFPGIALGRAAVFRRRNQGKPVASGAPGEEQRKFDAARAAAHAQLAALYEQAKEELGQDEAAIIEVQMMLLDDPDYLEGVESAIQDGASAAEAAIRTGESFAQMFAAMADAYMSARAADVRDMAQRLYDILCGHEGYRFPAGSFVLLAEDISPSEAIQLPRERVLAFVTRQGSSSSHTAILARTLNLPSLVQADIDLTAVREGDVLAVDGLTGAWYLNPDAATEEMLQAKQKQLAADLQELESYRGRESVTRSGKRVLLAANIASTEDARAAFDADAEGIGLMRSEFLYLGRDAMPSEEELFEAYREVAQIMGERPVIIRTLDIGADKQVSYMGLEGEDNPALGMRGLRICLTREEVIRPQLRAIYRASAHGNLSVMFPMVASVWELQAAKALCGRIRAELEAEGAAIRDIPIGVMVETPAAAILADDLAREADFFSVGTNDLTQYTLAVDRQNARVGAFHDPHHPALMALMAHIARAAKAHGIPAGVCGELAADESVQLELVRMGYTELSMAPGRILATRRLICSGE